MPRLPSLFVSHGAPTFALEHSRAAALLAGLGRRLSKPRAVLVLSAHWMTAELTLGTDTRPGTIHDFGGFPSGLYALQYPAPGAPDVALAARGLLEAAGRSVRLDPGRGLDHGVWVPLMHLYPGADVPVVPLSMPAGLDPAGAWQLGSVLAPLAEEGILIMGSGSLTHNLAEFRLERGRVDAGYASLFVDWVRDALLRGDRKALLDYRSAAPHARRAHPTADHYLPLPFAAAAAGENTAVEILDGGMTHGTLSMESYVFGDTGTAATPAPAAAPAR